jgi:hypothetical protein
MQDKRFD